MYRMEKRVLITGGAGFIGSHVAIRLGVNFPSYKIIILDKLDYCSSLKNLVPLRHLLNVKFVEGDIRSADLLRHLIKSENIDTVLHFAAQSHVDNSFGNSFEFTKNNIEGTHVLLESCRLSQTVRRFVHVSTDEVYGESSYDLNSSNTENGSLLAPTNPYSATKAGAEMLVMAYGRSYNLPFIITRGNNVYGPNQYPEKAIPKFSVLAKHGREIPIHGDGLATRSYMHVEDAAAAFDVILHEGEIFHIYNIGAHEERTVLSVAQDICRVLGRDPDETITHVRNRAFNDRRYFIDCSKLHALGWRQQKTWYAGLAETVAWYSTQDLESYWGSIESALVPHPVLSTNAITNVEHESQSSTNESLQDPIFLIYGRTGWIGGMLGSLLAERGCEYYYGSARLYDRGALKEDILRCRPTHILNAAGITGRPNVDWCETHKREVVQSNVLGTLTLIDLAKSMDIHVTNFATGCIYSYDDDHAVGGPGFTETDVPNFRGSYYSYTKAVVEDLIQQYDNVLQLRLRMPIDSNLQNPRNFIYKIANYAKVVNVPNSMTVLDELVPLAIDGAIRKLTGIYNFTNPGVISHNEVLELYREYYDSSFTWENFSLEEQSKILAAPRSNNMLDTTKLKLAFPGVLDIKTSLKRYVFNKAKARK